MSGAHWIVLGSLGAVALVTARLRKAEHERRDCTGLH